VLACSVVAQSTPTPSGKSGDEGLPLPGSPPPTVVHNADGSTTSISQSRGETTSTTVDQNGAAVSRVSKRPLYSGGKMTTIDAGTVTTKTEYDSQGNVVRLERVDSSTGTRNVFEYDDKGQLLKASTFKTNADGKEEPQEIYQPQDTPSGKPERYNPETGKFERVGKSDQDDIESRLKKTADEIKALQDKYALSDEDEQAAIRAEAAKHPMAGPGENQSVTPTPTPSGLIDSCLVGTWECVSYKEASMYSMTGGTGFRVTFKSDGTETVDYSRMKPVIIGGKASEKTTWKGTATARISTHDGMAKLETAVSGGVAMGLDSGGRHVDWPKLAMLGPGGLGSLKGSSSYKCSGDSLEYGSSTRADQHPNCVLKLRRVEEEEDFGAAGGTGQPVGGKPKPDKSKGSATPVVSPKPTSPKPPPPKSPPPPKPPFAPQPETPTATPKPKPAPGGAGGKPQPSATLQAATAKPASSTSPTVSPSPRPSASSPTQSVSPSATATPSARPSPTTQPTVSATLSPAKTPSPFPSATLRPASLPSPTPTPSPMSSLTPAKPRSPSPSATLRPTGLRSPTPTVSKSPLVTPSPTSSLTPAKSRSPSPSPSRAQSPAPPPTKTRSPSPSATASVAESQPSGGSSGSGAGGESPSAPASSFETPAGQMIPPMAIIDTEYGDETIAHDPALPLLIYAGPIAYSSSYRAQLVNAESIAAARSAGATPSPGPGSRTSFPIKFTSEKNGEYSVRLSFEIRDENGNVPDIAIRPLRSAKELEPLLALEHVPSGLFRFGIDASEFAKLKPAKYSIRVVLLSDKTDKVVSSPGFGKERPLTIELKTTGLTSDQQKIDLQQAARFYLRDRDYAKAEKLSDAARALDGLSVGAWEVRGEALLAQNRSREAEEAFKKALQNVKLASHPGLRPPVEESAEHISKYLEKIGATGTGHKK